MRQQQANDGLLNGARTAALVYPLDCLRSARPYRSARNYILVEESLSVDRVPAGRLLTGSQVRRLTWGLLK